MSETRWYYASLICIEYFIVNNTEMFIMIVFFLERQRYMASNSLHWISKEGNKKENSYYS